MPNDNKTINTETSNKIGTRKRVLSVFSLVMINVIAVDSLRTLPLGAKLGLSLVTYYILAAFIFFIPVALVAAELATAFPQTGGMYVWVREAFGRRVGFIAIWLQWIYNVVWYPTIMAFIAATIAYIFAPHLSNDKSYLLMTIIALFWLFTLLNCFGMKVSGWLSTAGALFGTLLPMICIGILGITWYTQGHLPAWGENASWLPKFDAWGNFSLFGTILFGLIGMEMSAVHAEEVKNPQKDYPKALLISMFLIFSTLVLGSLAIAIVVPQSQLSIVSGILDASSIFFNTWHMPWMVDVLACLIILGCLSGVSAWIIGPTKGLLVCAHDGSLPKALAFTNKHGAPTTLLLLQAIVFTALSSLFILVHTINEAYWLLNDLCDQLALLAYIFMFAAAIKLRYSQPDHYRAYKIPGGNISMWIIAGVGILCCSFTILIGFVPPTQIPINNIWFFELFLIIGLFVFIGLPWFFSKKHGPSY